MEQVATNELTEKLKKACIDVRKGAEAICAIEKDKLDAIEKQIETISSHVQNPELREAQCNHEMQKSILDALRPRVKVAIATFRPTLSVEIISSADPAKKL